MLRQLFGVALGVSAMIAVSLMDYSWIMHFKWIFYAANLVMLALVILNGHSSHGATRWIQVGPIVIQPVEVTKVLLVIFFAGYFMERENELNDIKTILKSIVLAAAPLSLIFMQPDLKNTLTILVIFAILYYVAGISYKVIAIIVLILTLAGGSLALYLFNVETKPFFLRDYQWERVIAFRSTDNESSQDDNRQQLNSVMAIGSGMLTGKGLNNDDAQSANKGNFISEIDNDFIFAVAGEEMGFIGCAGIILLLLLVVLECIRTGSRAKDLAGRLIGCGIGSIIAIQSFINIGVATMLLPNTGTPLPFISYGLTSLVSLYIGIGFVLNVGLQTRIRLADVRARRFGKDFSL
jgi:rod shape determining protein RodA